MFVVNVQISHTVNMVVSPISKARIHFEVVVVHENVPF